MIFNSLSFLIFFPIVMLLYYIMPKKVKTFWLLICSYYFYACWNPKYVLLLLFSTVVTFLCSLCISKTEEHSKRKAYLIIAVLLNLLVLILFKYFNFLFINIKDFLHAINIYINIPKVDFVLPVAISFYTLQSLGYVIDVYKGKTSAEHNFINYALFVSFFPQLVAGPIERSNRLLNEIKKEHKFNYESVRKGFLIMLCGFAIKLIIADRIALFVDTIYDGFGAYTGSYFIVATVLFVIQLYCDFYGYSTIALGTAQMLDIRLMKNFDAPFLSTSVKEFWRRWHISLGSWFRDYVYIPLGGNKKRKT